MNKKPLISVIIPVYNVQDYLERCLNSVINQTYKNIEIILVNDGSKDNSQSICENYLKKYKNIRIINQENKGLSAARNIGVECSMGEYIVFIDSDDYVDTNYVEYLYKLLVDNEADISAISPIIVYDNAVNKEAIYDKRTMVYEDMEKCLSDVLYGKPFGVSAHNKLYKKELIMNNPYPVGLYHEDELTTYKVIEKCNKVVFGYSKLYYYYQRDDSIMNCKINDVGLKSLEYINDNCLLLQNKYPRLKNAAIARNIITNEQYIQKIFKSNHFDVVNYEKIKKHILKNMKIEILFDKKISIFLKIRCLLLLTDFPICSFFYKQYFKLRRAKYS